MPRGAAKSVRFFLVALLACCSLSWVAAGFALADEPTEYVAPVDRALEPELPEMASCPNVVPSGIEEEKAEGEVEPISPELRELAHMRQEAQQSCRAQTDRLDQVIERLWWVTSQELALDHPDAGIAEADEWLKQAAARDETTQEDVHQLRGLFEDAFTDTGSHTLRHVLLGSEESLAVPVSGGGEGGGKGTEELVSSIDAAGEASQAGLYLIAGLLAGLFVAGCLWKVVDRGT
jgi:hypothetical protein